MQIDVNADVGESFGQWTLGDDAAMLQLVTSANVACGFHAGDPSTARRTCRAAAAAGVAIGAHVGYRDLQGFGRRALDVDTDDLADDVLYQIGALTAIARGEGVEVSYVKPHGALYNRIAHDPVQAEAVLAGVVAAGDLAVVGPPGSVVLRLADLRGIRKVREGFADRAYMSDGTLVPRSEPGSVLHDPAAVADRVLRMARENTVIAADGTVVPLEVDTVCVHGDSPGAVALARAIRDRLADNAIDIRPHAA
ncbi:LamB/YcsF family protein [Tsukamurella sputi]|uniref:5-oxoprolinase subunit A n=1 Tax=Tsukamurella sputi TaxID=2591848 RepID=A0A5C5RNN9_9ACTN|nr:5-oxoprolinase subunit PxpA [Tsukamurella sputi]TWS24677.1 LamB/YcsF family protein [Tsukamurella sputi]